ncbi:HAD family hydrolase [Actinocorallia longicatena]|uniref:HAD family hydrolase n=1 Tax=Actinocorallia longicatena TaxID=111803 RepID=A0ABP6QNQ0_9ACTN
MIAACTDLDRTLIYSANALMLADPDAALRCVEIYDLKPLSYLTDRSAALIELLATSATLVPTTTRTPAQYRRIRLPGPPPRFAICANGGYILEDGEEDPSWTARVRKAVADCAPAVDVHDHMSSVSGTHTLNLKIAAELFPYAVVDRAALPETWLADLAAWCADRRWTVSLQGRKVYCLPEPLTKSAAAAEVARRCDASHLVAAGDSLLDTELLRIADAAVRPAHGELEEQAWTAENVTITESRGVRAGEEIAAWLLARALAPAFVPRTGLWRTLTPASPAS